MEYSSSYTRYHTPSDVWTAFSGATDFESDVENFVIRGRFHNDVPPEVVEGYAIAEHIMAHAYYHYPTMDEALVKLLRVLEMAVKMRCKQLGIDLETVDKKGKSKKKVLSTLINELAVNEIKKPIKGTLNWLRDVRNYLMHPGEPSLFGTFALGHIEQCLIMLNALFLPELYFQNTKAELDRVCRLCQKFEKGLFVLEHSNYRYIIYQSEFIETYYSGGEWRVLCAFHAVPDDLNKWMAEHRYPTPLVFLVKNFQIGKDQLAGVVEECGESFVLSINSLSENAKTLARFEQDKSQMNEEQKMLFRVALIQGLEK